MMRPFLRLFNALKANGESHTAALLGREDPHRTRRLGRKAVGLARLQRYRLRKILHEDIFALVLAAACVGAASGIISSLMVSLSEILHRYLFALAPGEQLSTVTHLSSVNTLLVLAAGGLVVGTTYRYQSGRRHLIVDPILRGEAILGGEDIGWTRQTTARDLMRQDLATAPLTMRLSEFRSRFPLGSAKFIAAIDPAGASLDWSTFPMFTHDRCSSYRRVKTQSFSTH